MQYYALYLNQMHFRPKVEDLFCSALSEFDLMLVFCQISEMTANFMVFNERNFDKISIETIDILKCCLCLQAKDFFMKSEVVAFIMMIKICCFHNNFRAYSSIEFICKWIEWMHSKILMWIFYFVSLSVP